MAGHNETTIYSIFGQIESVVANQMTTEGKVRKIDPSDMMPATLYSKEGRRAFFAIIVPRKYLGEFESRVKELYY